MISGRCICNYLIVMEFLASTISPITVLFTVIIIGYFIGKIRICRISLDIAAILFVAILVGYALFKFCPMLINDEFNDIMNSYSKIGTFFFMAVVGITSGFSLKVSSGKMLLHMVIGICCTCAGLFCMKMISLVDTSFDKSTLLGILCGALTSTPGLSTVSGRSDVISANAAIGYGSAYLFGLICVVTFVQGPAFALCKCSNCKPKENETASVSNDIEGLVAIATCGVLGELLGKISWFHYSLGATGGILICGIIMGLVLNKYPRFENRINQSFHMYRNFGLAMFFVGNGIPAGYSLRNGIDIKCLLYGAIITIASLITVNALGRMLFKKHETRVSTVAGSMTSTPALGVLVKKGYAIDFSAYSLSYLGALASLTIILKFIYP